MIEGWVVLGANHEGTAKLVQCIRLHQHHLDHGTHQVNTIDTQAMAP
jgi:hypothetical protein